MPWYQEIYSGEMAKYWEKILLGETRYIENVLVKNLLKDGLVLDLGCGPGSHTTYISKYQRVIGLDLSPELIKKAKEECKNSGNYKNVCLMRGDMRKLPFESEFFDNVIHILSFGFFSDEEDKLVFSEIARVLKRCGIYVYQNFYHPPSSRPLKWELDYLSSPDTPKDYFVTKKRRYDPKTKRIHIKEIIENLETKKKIKLEFTGDRLYDVDELKELHKQNGLKIEGIFSGLEMKEFDPTEFNLMTIVSKKK